ncbi:hypothetical protein BC827DRAFT_1226638 [Russula dissimulans]|nr:hypothetical protein BC827DRAFT_1226638 [Russula dissimulans]
MAMLKVSSPRRLSSFLLYLFGSYIFAARTISAVCVQGCPCTHAWSCGIQRRLLFDVPHHCQHAHALRNMSRPSLLPRGLVSPWLHATCYSLKRRNGRTITQACQTCNWSYQGR